MSRRGSSRTPAVSLALTALLAGFSTVVPAQAQEATLPWLTGTPAETARAGFHTVRAHADVVVSDGLTYSTSVVYHDPQRAVFHRVYEDRTVVEGVEGLYFWRYDGEKEVEGTAFFQDFVLGHQMHAQILFFDRLFPEHTGPQPGEFDGQSCMRMTVGEGDSEKNFYYDPDGRPLGLVSKYGPEMTVTLKYDDWQQVGEIMLPFYIWIDDGDRQFEYRYTEIVFNDGSIYDYKAPVEVLTEEQKLLRLHRLAMDGHLWGDVGYFDDVFADSVYFVSSGDIYRNTGEDAQGTLGRILTRNHYTVYDDLIRPIVRVSDDGTKGWVIVQVGAEGIRHDESGEPVGPIEFVCAWIELYEKHDGRWLKAGNVSNFRE